MYWSKKDEKLIPFIKPKNKINSVKITNEVADNKSGLIFFSL